MERIVPEQDADHSQDAKKLAIRLSSRTNRFFAASLPVISTRVFFQPIARSIVATPDGDHGAAANDPRRQLFDHTSGRRTVTHSAAVMLVVRGIAMTELGVALLTFADAGIDELVSLGRYAEGLGYTSCYTTESLTDTLAIDLAIAMGTERIRVGSFVAISYMRHPVIAAQSAVVVSDLSGGRFVLGLGVGHRLRVEALGIEVGKPSGDLPAYIRDVRALLDGHGSARYPDLPPQSYRGVALDFRTSVYPVPIYAAAVGPRMAEAGAAVANGLMVYLVPRAGLAELAQAAAKGAQAVGRAGSVPMDLAVHAFVDDDLVLARECARASLAYWVGLPAYNAALARAGYEAEAAEQRTAFAARDEPRLRAAITDRLIDDYCLVGPPTRCREQLAAWQETGAATLAIMPDPVAPGERYTEAVRRTLAVLAP
ncbi:MAG: LLM class flavin-dependent oxidoreductase [Nocardioidaceae bacterium]